MSEQLREFGRKVTDRLNSENVHLRRRWQAIVGATFMVVFVIASVAVNQTVLALNQGAGYYGYVSGTYGYDATASSDALPSAPTSLSTSNITSDKGTLAWTAPTTTINSTSLNNLSSYKIHYSTSSLSACSGGSSTTTTAASATLASLSANTKYYVAVCATDSNSNDSSALTGDFTTAQASTGGGGGGGSTIFGGTTAATTTTTTGGTTTAAPTGVASIDAVSAPTTAAATASAIGVAAPTASALTQATNLVMQVVPADVFSSLSSSTKAALEAFVAVGPLGVTADSSVVKIGAGERASLIEAFQHSQGGAVPTTARHYQFIAAHIVNPVSLAQGEAANDVTKLFPDMRNLTIERDGLKDFTNCNKRPPSVDTKGQKLAKTQQDKEWAFVKYTGYQLKVDPSHRSLGDEAKTIKAFKAAKIDIYKNGKKTSKAAGKNPSDLFDWNFIRAATYSGAPSSCLR